MLEGGFSVDHINEYNTVTDQLNSIGVKFDDGVKDLLILCSLLEIWNALVMVVIKFVFGSSTLNFDDVVSVILSEEMRQKSTRGTTRNDLTMEIRRRRRERKNGPRISKK